jgi:hypothetical protein
MSFIRSWILFALFTSLCTIVYSQELPQRIALVIGIQSYPNSPLRNSLKDAKDMVLALKQSGFDVIELYDPTSKKDIKGAVLQYFDRLTKNPGAVGLIYYSGHGMQVDGYNYLIPTSANPQIKEDIEEECLRLDYIMEALERSSNSLNILVLDACRNNPFRSFSRSAERGLSMVSTPPGSYIVYATKPGSVASDGSGDNGLFTSKLLKHIKEPNLKLEEVFKRVVRDVSLESGNLQRPWIASDFDGDFYFNQQNDSLSNELGTKPSIVSVPVQRNGFVPKEPPIDITNIRGSVLIYRPSSGGTAIKCDVILDSKPIAKLENKGRIALKNLKYGVYRLNFRYQRNSKSVTISILNNEDVFVRWTSAGPALVDPESGKRSFDSFKKDIQVIEIK